MKRVLLAILAATALSGCITGPTHLQTPLQHECSQRADALDLHGHERWAFRHKCLGRP